MTVRYLLEDVAMLDEGLVDHHAEIGRVGLVAALLHGLRRVRHGQRLAFQHRRERFDKTRLVLGTNPADAAPGDSTRFGRDAEGTQLIIQLLKPLEQRLPPALQRSDLTLTTTKFLLQDLRRHGADADLFRHDALPFSCKYNTTA